MSRRFVRYVAGLDDAEALELHRVVCRRAGAIYLEQNRDKHAAGVAAAAPRQEAGYALHRERLARL